MAKIKSNLRGWRPGVPNVKPENRVYDQPAKSNKKPKKKDSLLLHCGFQWLSWYGLWNYG